MFVKAYAKINLSLDVIGKRKDGYHLLKMIMQSIDLYDEIEITKRDTGINIKCNKPYVPLDDKNIAYRAAKIFLDKYNIHSGVFIDIRKNIPVSAGLAGGSTNAAAVLKSMSELYGLNIKKEELMDIGLKIGADIPYCIIGGTALCEGIGEKVKPLKPFRDKILVLVKPNFGVSTKEVYKAFDINKVYKHPKTHELIDFIVKDDLTNVALNMRNVLENVTIKEHPVIRDIKQTMISMGALGSLMSGSGPSVFGFFEDTLKAQRCFEVLKRNYKEVFITRTI
ncbi:4-(cytidine 5'-diphospho)-2-C-methyl-D-erythritol kinase [Haloimpatiens sp. FM7315]|uniref:4-(cytidine 5'-diphospho)-2-C-methyl-D-erythritol kinase n=1 Tax=Haloimpatiens sp. FM7315 TaxID=3298609 RepID=UPI0035A3BEBC